jgi:hypothetical protein
MPSDLGLRMGAGDGERVTGIEPALSAWEVSSAIRSLRAETLICGILARQAASDPESPPGLIRSGTTSLPAALPAVGKTHAKKTPWRSFSGVLVAVTGRGKLPARIGRWQPLGCLTARAHCWPPR